MTPLFIDLEILGEERKEILGIQVGLGLEILVLVVVDQG
jgi:hypothetical protein